MEDEEAFERKLGWCLWSGLAGWVASFGLIWVKPPTFYFGIWFFIGGLWFCACQFPITLAAEFRRIKAGPIMQGCIVTLIMASVVGLLYFIGGHHG